MGYETPKEWGDASVSWSEQKLFNVFNIFREFYWKYLRYYIFFHIN